MWLGRDEAGLKLRKTSTSTAFLTDTIPESACYALAHTQYGMSDQEGRSMHMYTHDTWQAHGSITW